MRATTWRSATAYCTSHMHPLPCSHPPIAHVSSLSIFICDSLVSSGRLCYLHHAVFVGVCGHWKAHKSTRHRHQPQRRTSFSMLAGRVASLNEGASSCGACCRLAPSRDKASLNQQRPSGCQHQPVQVYFHHHSNPPALA